MLRECIDATCGQYLLLTSLSTSPRIFLFLFLLCRRFRLSYSVREQTLSMQATFRFTSSGPLASTSSGVAFDACCARQRESISPASPRRGGIERVRKGPRWWVSLFFLLFGLEPGVTRCFNQELAVGLCLQDRAERETGCSYQFFSFLCFPGQRASTRILSDS